MQKSKSTANQKEVKENLSEQQPVTDDSPITGATEGDSIEDFIELKRLQNRILGKILQKINPAEIQNKSKNK